MFCEGGRLANETHCMENSPFILDCYVPRLGGQKNNQLHTKATMIRSKDYKYVKRLYEQDEFYDLNRDKMELCNAIDEPEYAEKILEMKMAMLEWYQRTCDIVPFAEDGRCGNAFQTLIEQYVPDELKAAYMEKARMGGYTLDEFETMCQNC